MILLVHVPFVPMQGVVYKYFKGKRSFLDINFSSVYYKYQMKKMNATNFLSN
jgi:hypothetical protein